MINKEKAEVIVSNSFDDWDKLNIPNLKVIDVWD